MKKLLAALLALGFLVHMGCGEAKESEFTTAEPVTDTSTLAPTTEEPFTLDPNRPIAIMEPVQGGPMLYTFTGKNGKLGLINQDGELVAEPQYEQPNYWDYSATYSLRAEYTRDANGRVNGITLQKGEKGEEIIHYTLDGKSRLAEGFPAPSEHGSNRNEDLYDYSVEETGTILGADRKPLYTAKPGEEIIRLYPVPYQLQLMGLVVQDAQGSIVKAVDYNGKPMQAKSEAQFFSDKFLLGGTLYKLKDGKWTTLDLRQFLKPDAEDYSATYMVVTEDWVIVVTSFFESIDEIFAIDWTGKPYEDCPLMPFISGHFLHDAGEQGPNYYWVEKDGKRGYVNTKGEWLFIEQ